MNDEIYRKLAQDYLKQHAAELRRELHEPQLQELFADTSNLDRRVHTSVAALRRARFVRIGGGLIAACLVFAVMLPSISQLFAPSGFAPSSSAGAASSSAPPASSSAQPDSYEILPLGFTLPPQFSVNSVELDNGKTVYRLDDSALDPVVMTMQRTAQPLETAQLTPVVIDGRTVYAHSDAAYHLLTFEQDGIVYELTCKYDINTLVTLSKNI